MDTHPAHLELTDTHPTHLSSHTMAMNLIMAAVQTMHTVRKRPWRMIRITAGRLTVPCLAIAGITEPSTRTLTTPAPSRNRSIRILPMTRIVTSHYCYQRPSRKRQAVALEVPGGRSARAFWRPGVRSGSRCAARVSTPT